MATKIIIKGGTPLRGDIAISGMKNAALPILFATVLVGDVCVLENIPQVSDIATSLEILAEMGARVSMRKKNTVCIDTSRVRQGTSPLELVKKLRGSTYLLGAELGRFGRATVGWPGGCDFGSRPLDQHMKGFEKLGATVSSENGYHNLSAPNGLRGGSVYFDVASVGATANVMMAAVLAEGTTEILKISIGRSVLAPKK
jgi:UDP-N-acetylglucosamine 1-carboxyvinyltransferase